ncbi:FAD-dependent monooxygenase [Kocuria rosea]|uniref:FAD-dependent monooxygenase n=1 Tax=Kocuria rosea TaxID=1275 RepID=UPI000DFC2C04|nr:FAD-dependent monooxygenase [Kocuria rosea]STX05713.1 6-hydroxynicotinate 3-monooxygenase precursor [Kocuria rosea]
MPAVQKIGIVGSGIGGLTLAALLADAGLTVEVLEKAEGPSTLGSGITLQGNALRILRDLGLWEQLQEKGYPFNTLGLRAPGPEATVLAVLDDVRVGGEDLPATLGIPRRELAAIVRARTEAAGAVIRYRVTVTGLEQDGDAVTVTTAAGETLAYDLLVGADGLNSAVRTAIGIEDRPRRTGMGIWRAFVPRPAEVTRTDLYYGGPAYIAGYCPTGPDTMYAYLVEDAQDRRGANGPAIMGELAASYGGPWQEIRSSLDEHANVNYTHFTTHLVAGSWHRGRVVLLGDAAHSCPPTIAQGAAMAVEDAAVLADELLRAEAFDEAVLTRYWQRRLPRAKTVVEASVQLGQWMLEGKRDADVPGLMQLVADTVKVPV